MTQDEIIRMAREAGAYRNKSGAMVFLEDAMLERFAALVAANEREKQAKQEPVGVVTKEALDGVVKWKRWVPREGTKLYAAPVSIEAAVLAEREACAKVVESGVLGHGECAAAIRARGE